MIHKLSKNWRAKVTNENDGIVISIQRRYFLIFWESVYPFHRVYVTIGTGFLHNDFEPWKWGRDTYGGWAESWKPGQFDLKKRIESLHKEALEYIQCNEENLKQLTNYR